MKKTFVLDTNVLLSDTNALHAFDDNDLIIPMVVLEELDNIKSRQDEVGQNARTVSRQLDQMRSQGSLNEGIATPGGGTLKIVPTAEDVFAKLPVELRTKYKIDNVIIAYAYYRTTCHLPCVVVSNDINVRLKCDALGVESEDYKKLRVCSEKEQLYSGVSRITLSTEEIDNFYEGKPVTLSPLLSDHPELHPNEILVIKDKPESKSALARYIDVGVPIRKIENKTSVFGLTPRNKEQQFALDLIFDDSIKLVTFTGKAGCVTEDTIVSIKVNDNPSMNVKIIEIDKLLKDNVVYANSPVGYQQITNFLDQGIKKCYDVTFENGKKLRCSNDHMIRLFNGDWIRIDQIVNDMQLLDSTEFQTDSGDSKILNIENIGNQRVYDLSIGHDDHSYYTNGVVSHNCGKTLLSVAAGLELVLEKKKYDRLVITRPVQAVGKDIGFLPGTKEEKMEPWIAPIRDNLGYLFKSAGKKFQKVSKDNEGTKTFKSDPYIDMLFEKGIIEIEAVTYMRGRSIPNSFIIIDEAQNLSIHELKTIITRVGDNTKIILTGDIEQIDNTHVDVFTNGLTYAVEKFKDYAIAGHVTLVKGERSQLATLASQIL